MSTSICNISCYDAIASAQRIRNMQRPEAESVTNTLFSNLDTGNKGYLEQSDFDAAFSSVADFSSVSGTSSSSKKVFSLLDSNGDGQVTKTEVTDGLKNLDEIIGAQIAYLARGGVGPETLSESGQEGLTQDELSSLASVTEGDEALLLNALASNFAEADKDGNGVVDRGEGMAFDAANGITGRYNSSSTSNTSTSPALDTGLDMMRQIGQLAAAYSGISYGSSNLFFTA